MRLACVQADVAFADPAVNARAVIERLEVEAAAGTDLAVFPECFLTGYCVGTVAQAAQISIPHEHPAVTALCEAAADLRVGVSVGYVAAEGESLFNVAMLVLPDGTRHVYRKTHLPFMGVDRFVQSGAALEVVQTPWGRVGTLVCFDLRFPEAVRALALQGAELVLLPTNWPTGAEASPGFILPVRAIENRIFMAACNRVGTENGFRFIGRSKIVGIEGEVLAEAGEEACVIRAELDLTKAHMKRRVVIPGEYETDIIGARRPELYTPLTGNNGFSIS